MQLGGASRIILRVDVTSVPGSSVFIPDCESSISHSYVGTEYYIKQFYPKHNVFTISTLAENELHAGYLVIKTSVTHHKIFRMIS